MTTPKYIRVSQGLLDWKPADMLLTLNNVFELSIDINMQNKVETFEDEPAAKWGTAVYMVEDTGALVYVKDNFDTSG